MAMLDLEMQNSGVRRVIDLMRSRLNRPVAPKPLQIEEEVLVALVMDVPPAPLRASEVEELNQMAVLRASLYAED